MNVPAAILASSMAGPVCAQAISCQMGDVAVDFIIDPSQFIDSVTPEEPIRRKVTVVQMGTNRFPAEPFIIGDIRGFHAEGPGGANVMFVTRPDGSAHYVNTTTGDTLDGTCEVRR